MADKKKLVGSVAVDSQTGMEHYNQPKQYGATSGEQPTSSTVHQSPENVRADTPGAFNPNAPTPNYGEVAGDGMHAGKNLAGVPSEFLKLFEHDPSEVIMMQTTRHWIGLVGIYGSTALAILIIMGVYGFLAIDSTASESFGISVNAVRSLGGLLALFLSVFIGLIGLVGGYVYNKSRLILTNQKVVYINYHSLISRQISQLNIGEVEDVSVIQPTLLQRIFRIGTITIETAGEQHNYKFTNATKPHEFAHRTIQAHEGTIREYGN